MIVIGIVAAVALLSVFYFNRIVKLENMSKEAWSDVNVQLKRRYDLIPNLVTVVKGYMGHEKNTLKELTELRNTALKKDMPELKELTENKIADSLRHIIALAENYPDLKASEQFLELQRNLADIEDKLQISRRYYNATIRNYNIALHSFPSNIIANIFNFKEQAYFEIDTAESKNIKVAFNEK